MFVTKKKGSLFSHNLTYLVQMGEGGPIKIGRSENPIQRVKALQTGSPEDLLIIGLSYDDESLLHHRFREHHIKREWFSPHAEILEYVESLPQSVSDVINKHYVAHFETFP